MSSMGNILKYLGATLAASDTGAPSQGEDSFSGGGVTVPQSPVQAGALPSPSDLSGGLAFGQEALAQANQGAAKATNRTIAAQNKASKQAKVAADTELQQGQKIEQALAPEYRDIAQKSKEADQHLSSMFAQAEQERQAGLDNYLGAVSDLQHTTVYNWYAKADTGAKILGILSQALAGGLQGLQGRSGPTPMDKVIDDDIRQQQMELSRKSDVARQRAGAYSQLQDALKDTVAVEAGMRDLAYNSAKERLKALAASQGGEANANYQKALAMIEQSHAANTSKIQQFYAQAGLDSARQAAGTQFNYNSLWGQQAADAAKAATSKKEDTSYGVVNVPGFEYYSKQAPAEAAKLKGAIDSAESAKALIGDLANKIVVRKEGDKVIYKSDNLFSKDDKAAMDQIINQAILRVKDASKLGALSESDKQLAEASVGADNSWGARFMRELGFTSYDAMYKRLQQSAKTIDRDLSTSVGRIVIDTPQGRRRLTYTPDPTN